jgi:tRNA modification GTPase
LVRTKADITPALGNGRENRDVQVSALSGEGLAELRSKLAELAFSTLASRADLEPIVTRARHREALMRAAREIEAFRAAREQGIEGAVAATHLRAAVTALEGIIGIVSTDDVLDRLFATFCVGK